MNTIKFSSAIKNNSGFTLVEVVIVLVLVSILAVTAAKKFFGSSPYQAYTFRASLLSALRLTQQRAMQQTSDSFCHQLIINDHRYGIPDRNNCSVTDLSTFDVNNLDKTSLIVDISNYNVTFSIEGKTNPSTISFDDMGRPLNDCVNGCNINIISELDNLTIEIEPEGYVHAL